MFKMFRLVMVLLVALALLPTSFSASAEAAASAAPVFPPPPQPTIPANCTLGTDTNGSQTLICAPVGTPYGDPLSVTLVIFSHGYVWPYIPPKTIPWDQMTLTDPVSGAQTFVPDLVTSQGYYFATTSYRANGLVVQDAIQDLLLVRKMAIDRIHADQHYPLLGINVVLAGVSEGGLITTLSIERSPTTYNGGLSMCGPIGDFKKQVTYWGDFRSLLDVYYANIKDYPPGTGSTTIRIPDKLVNDWYLDVGGLRTTFLTQAVAPANIARTQDLLYVAKAPYGVTVPTRTDPPNAANIEATLLGLLNYNILATNNGQAVLGGNPFDNTRTVYPNSALIPNINQKVARYAATGQALTNLKKYQTTGIIVKPLVVLHTTGDPIVPYWHATLYQTKTVNSPKFKLDTVSRYGHCAFTQAEVLSAFADLGAMMNPLLAAQAQSQLTPAQYETYQTLLRQGAVLRQKGVPVQTQ